MSKPDTSPEDYKDILALNGSDGMPRILVGGHAVNVWAEHYLKEEPSLAEFMPFRSKDLDILGTSSDLEDVARKTGLKCERAENRTFIPSAGYLLMKHKSGEFVKVEILKRIYGVTSESLKERASELVHQGIRIRVIDPLTLLRAKTENSVHLEQNKPGYERQDVKHMQIMLIVAHAFLKDTIKAFLKSEIDARDVLSFHEEYLSFAKTETARKAAAMYRKPRRCTKWIGKHLFQ